MHALIFAVLLKAATVIVSGSAGASAPGLVSVGVGTGVVVARIDADHYAIVTAGHVAQYRDPHVALYGHRHLHPYVEMAVADPRGEDLAILIVKSAAVMPVIPLASRAPRVGARLEVVGHPYAHTWRVAQARYVEGAIPPRAELQPLMSPHATVWICQGCDRGNSGSGIYDSHGKLSAVIYAAAPLPRYGYADEVERRTDRYNPRIVRQVLAVDAREVRSLLEYAKRQWSNKGYASAPR